MYQVLQVYTSFSFFDNFLSRSIKVGQSSSRRRRLRVSETSLRRRGDVVATFPQSFGLEQVSETLRRKNRTCLVSLRLPRDPQNLQETSRRRLRDPRRLESPTGRQLVSMPVR